MATTPNNPLIEIFKEYYSKKAVGVIATTAKEIQNLMFRNSPAPDWDRECLTLEECIENALQK
jgi:hypothetical protein